MKTLKLISTFALILFFVTSCATKEPVSEPVEPVEPAPVLEPVEEPAPDVEIEEPEEIEEEEILDDGFMDEPEIIIYEEEQDEYTRSIGELDTSEISEETFTEDKEEILNIIEELEEIMYRKSFVAWTTYVCDESRDYWSNQTNLAELSEKLPGSKIVKLRTFKDYFEKFFIPARKGRDIDEIRYVTADLVKAVQYKNNEDITTYVFTRIDGQWKLWLEQNTDD